MKRVLIDSDVCLDYLLQRPDHIAAAESLFNQLDTDLFSAYVCAVSLTTIHYIVRKEKDKTVALAAVDTLLLLTDVCSVNRDVLKQARILGFKDYEDAVQCASAIAEGLDAIVTRNAKDFAKSPLPVHSPQEFVEVLKAESEGAESEP